MSNKLLEESGEVATEAAKRLSQSGNSSQLFLVVKAKSDAVKSNTASETGMLGQ